jgi:bacillolysin
VRSWSRVPRSFASWFWVVVVTLVLVPLAGADVDRVEAEAAAIRAQGGSASFVRSVDGATARFFTGRAAAQGATAVERAQGFLRTHGGAFALSAGSTLNTVRTRQDATGRQVTRFQQIVNGLPVAGGEAVVVETGGRITAAHALFVANADGVSPESELTESAAINYALETVRRLFPSAALEDVSTTASLEYLNKRLLQGAGPGPTRLAWRVEVVSGEVDQYVWVDAQRGVTLLTFSKRAHALNRNIYDMNSTATLPGTLMRSEGGAVTGNPEFDKPYDYSGHWFNYFSTNFGRNSYDNLGGALNFHVRACPAGYTCPMENAFWDPQNNRMLIGQGFGAADDVIAHELTHGLIQNEANLFYYMQSGALNEAYADIFGEVVDQTNAAGTDTVAVKWKLGEDLPIGAVRDMKTPTLFDQPGKMDDAEYACYGDPMYMDNGGVHINSGIANHAFQAMVDGGPVYGVTLLPVTLAKVAAVHYRALTNYLLTASGWADNYAALNQSCTDLVGTLGITAADCVNVKKALDTVKMNTLPKCLPAPVAKPALCPAGKLPHAPATFLADFESSPAFINGGTLHQWQWVTGYSTTPQPPLAPPIPQASWWGYDDFNPGNSTLTTTAPILVPTGAKLQFNHDFAFADFYPTLLHGGRVEYSTDGGTIWKDTALLPTTGARYQGPIPALWNGLTMSTLSAFGGQSWGYTATQVDLTSLAGQSMLLRFNMASDATPLDDMGWFIDDVQVYTCDAVAVSIAGPVAPIAEGNSGTTPFVFTFTLNGPTAAAVSIPFTVVPVTAAVTEDYTAITGSVVIPAGLTSGTLTVAVKGDTKNEANETFEVRMGAVVNAVISGSNSAAATILNDDTPPSLSIAPKTFVETTSTTVAGQMIFTVTLSAVSGTPVTVAYATAPSGAGVGFAVGGAAINTAGADYVNTSGTLTFPVTAGVTKATATITVPIIGDAVGEGSETFNLVLSSPTQATLGTATALGTITDNDLPGTFSFSAPKYTTAKEGTATVTVTVKRVGIAPNGTVDFTTSDGTATAGGDYTTTTRTLAFAANITTATVVIPIGNDTLAEGPEQFIVSLSNPQPAYAGAAIGTVGNAVVEIADNEPMAKFSTTAYTVAEGATLKIGLARGAGAACTVQVASSDGTAVAPADYTAVNLPVTLTTTTATLNFTAAQDTLGEGPETVTLTLTGGVGCNLDPVGKTAVVTIKDDEPAVTLTALTGAVAESSIDYKAMVTRTGLASAVIDVDCQTSDLTATAGSDYNATTTTVHLGAGVLSAPCLVHVNHDTVGEGNETFKVCLSNAVGALINNACTTVTITDNDPTVQFAAASYTVAEKTPSIALALKRTGSTAGVSTVTYQSSDLGAGSDHATANSDYTAVNATKSFAAAAAAASITVPILIDTTTENREAFQVCLSAPVNATLGPLSCTTIYITDDEPQLVFGAAAYVATEGGAAGVVVKRAGTPTSGVLTVNYTTSDVPVWTSGLAYVPGVFASHGGKVYKSLLAHTSAAGLEPNLQPTLWVLVTPGSAGVGTDYTLKSGTLTFPACAATCSGTALQQTISVLTTNDVNVEPDEAFQVCLSSPTGASLYQAAPYCVSVKITNNDVPGVFSLDSTLYTVGENGGTVTITVKRTGTAAATIDYATSNGTATAGSDYTATSGTLAFTGAQTSRTFTIPVSADVAAEPAETFSITLSNPVGATLGTPSTATVWLVNQ